VGVVSGECVVCRRCRPSAVGALSQPNPGALTWKAPGQGSAPSPPIASTAAAGQEPPASRPDRAVLYSAPRRTLTPARPPTAHPLPIIAHPLPVFQLPSKAAFTAPAADHF
jgi:hypothetical protein